MEKALVGLHSGPGEATVSTERRVPANVSRLTREALLVGLGYLVYSQVRGLSAGRAVDALGNASRVIEVEGKLGIFRELFVQSLVLPHEALIQFFNVVYFYGFFPLLLPTAAWLYLKRPAAYSLLRNAFLVSGAIAAVLFVLLPTAPPRLADVGFVDTLNRGLAPGYSSIPGVNQYAAFPSMHVGWTLLTAIGLYMALDRNPLRYAVWALPGVMLAATVVTGNHYFIDGMLGIGVGLIGLTMARLLRARHTLPLFR